jgi:hypothetical protein
MYLYYLFTGIGMGKALAPWKKYLTTIQMVSCLNQQQPFTVTSLFNLLGAVLRCNGACDAVHQA